jgi:hypothetical protein
MSSRPSRTERRGPQDRSQRRRGPRRCDASGERGSGAGTSRLVHRRGAAVPYATDHRTGHLAIGGGLTGGSAIYLEPVGDPRPTAAGTATFNYKATWRAVPDEPTIVELKPLGLWWFGGGPTDTVGSRMRMHLNVDAYSEEEAEQILRNVIEAGGKGPANIEVVGENKERVRGMAAAIREAREDAGT